MNFLAHLFLSCEREALVVGNFLADFIRNRDLASFPGGVQEGILLHRKIDSFTDRHPLVLQGVRRLYPYHSKYAPVIVDIYYDYFLALNWDEFNSLGLPEFTQQMYRILKDHQSIMPEKIGRRLALMIDDDWLLNYTHLDGMAYTFSRMRGRLSKPELLDGVMDSLERDHQALNEEFRHFFPDVIRFVERECLC